MLGKYGIKLDTGRLKNPHKNPVAEKAIQELQEELTQIGSIWLCSERGDIAADSRQTELPSAKEVIFQCDQHSGEQLSFNDVNLARNQEVKRVAIHPSSARSKAKGVPFATDGRMEVGDPVYIKREKSKGKARDRYLITKIEGDYAILQKLTKFFYQKFIVPFRIKKRHNTTSGTLNMLHLQVVTLAMMSMVRNDNMNGTREASEILMFI